MTVDVCSVELGNDVTTAVRRRRSLRRPLTDEEMASASLDWSHPNLAGITLDLLKDKGWARLNLPGPDEYAPHAHGNFPTPSGKVELRSSLVEQVGSMVLPVFREGSNEFQVGGEIDPLPHYVAPREDEGSPYPLYFLSPKAHAFLNSQYGNAARQRRVQGDEQWVLINSHDAEQRGIDDGDDVRIFNEHGEIHAVARIATHGDVAAGVIICPLGHWVKTTQGGATPNLITRRALTDLGNGPTFSDTRVDVTPKTGAA